MFLSPSHRLRQSSLVVLVVFLLAWPLFAQAQTDPLSEAKTNMAGLENYTFTADIEQTLIPRPIPTNIGQTEQRTDMRLTGEVTPPDQSEIHMRLEGAGPDVPPLTILQEGNDYFLLQEGERTPIENPLGTAVPNGDFLSYLNAADNIQPETDNCPADFTCYTFDINGRRFAEHIRDQMQMLDSSRSFGPSPLLQRLSGIGQLWINGAGLPKRQELSFHIPQLDDAYDADIHMIVDFSHPDAEAKTEAWNLGADNPIFDLKFSIFNFQSSISNSQFTIHNSLFIIPTLPYIAASLAIFLLFIRRRTRQLAYNIVAISMSLVMLTVPLLQPASITHAQTRQLESKSTLADALGLPGEQLSVSNDQSPLSSLQSSPSNSQLSASCGSGDPNTDTDNDGFNDRDENCYGTDPYAIDSDMDLITDTTEIEGIWFNGRTWPSDPISIDSNNDGLSDMLEWPYPIGDAPNDDDTISDADWDPDGDGTPNLWDDDNDGDNVYDSDDISPYYHSDYQDKFSLTTDAYDGVQYIELHLQPQNEASLRYSTTYLDWPHDEKGQWRDLDDSEKDLRLVPMLKITADTPPSGEIMKDYGLSAFCPDDEPCQLFAPLTPMSNGGRISAFAVKIAYDTNEPLEWDAIELVWMAQLNTDTEKGNDIKTSVTVAHTYDGGPFRLTGLYVTKNESAESAIFGTPNTPTDDKTLFNLLFGLSLSFLNNQNPDLTEIESRVTAPNTPDWQLWGVDNDDIVMSKAAYTHSDASVAGAGGRIKELLDDHYSPSNKPALIVATAENSGTYNPNYLALPANESSIAIDLSDVPMSETRSLRLAMYEDGNDGWELLALEEIIEELENRHSDLSAPLAELIDNYPDLEEADLRAVLAMFYTTWFVGQSRVHNVDGVVYAPDRRDDSAIADKLDGGSVSFLVSWLVESVNLGQPGGGLRVGEDLTQDWKYQREEEDKNALGMYDRNQIFFQGTKEGWQSFKNVAYQANQLRHAAAEGLNAAQCAYWAGHGTYRGLTGTVGAGSSAPHGWGTRMKSSARKLGFIGLAISIVLSIVTLVVSTDWSDPVSIQAGFAFAGASIIITVLLFALSLFPLGALLVAIFTLIDIIFLFATGGSFSPISWLIGKLATFFYDYQVLSYLDDTKFKGLDSGWSDPDMGMIVGNSFVISDKYVGVIKKGDGQGDHEDEALEDSKTYAYFDGSASGATAINQNGRRRCTIRGSKMTCTDPVGVKYKFNSPAINAKLTFESTITAKTFHEECRFAICKRYTDWTNLPGDLKKKDRWDPLTLYMDVLPASLDELWTWNKLTNPDPDGDGLLTSRENELGLNPNNWDSDGDGLSDKFEVDKANDLGCDADDIDSDDDGLNDGFEFRHGTRPDDPDSDGDGLSDADELYRWNGSGWVGGWPVNLSEYGGAALALANPTVADNDADNLNDYSERANQTSPHAYNDVPRLTLEAAPLQTSPGGSDGNVYVAPGDTVNLTLTLESVGPKAITDTLELCLPTFMTNISGGDMQGHRQPATQVNGNCLAWTFSGGDTLQIWETVSTTVSADVNPGLALSARSSISATLPYQLEGEMRDITAVEELIADADQPEATFMAPADGELIGGGVSSYVIGGTAVDDASWVTDVQLTLPGGSTTTEGTRTWAHTWSLPADGNYTLSATASDAVGHASAPDSVNVMVDNTAPAATLDLADGAVISGGTGNVITITLSGGASDNLSGLTRVQLSVDSRPWREVWSGVGTPLSIAWQNDWTLPNETASQGEHSVRVRAFDRAKNISEVLDRTIIVDVVPPTDQLTDNRYTTDEPPHVPAGQPLTLQGVANDAGRVPDTPNPADLTGNLHSVDDATIWLGAAAVSDDDNGVSVTWLGDFNGDRLADAAIGLPGAEEGDGRTTIILGKPGGWELPSDAELINNSHTSFIGSSGAGLGDVIAPAGDVNNDSFADLLIGDPANNRAFLVLGRMYDVGRDILLDGEHTTAIWQINGPADATIGQTLSGAGDVNGDGFDDLLIAATDATDTTTYLLLGRPSVWPSLDAAAATIDTNGTAVSLAGVGDRDNDEYDEFAVGAESHAYIFAGKGTFATSYQPEALTAADAEATFASADTAPVILPAGDVDGDDLPDFLYDNGSSPALVFANDLTFTFGGHDGFLAAPGDVNSDGRADILLGSGPGAHLFHGGSLGSVQATIEGVQTAASAPYRTGADLNSDDSDDLLLVPTASAREGSGSAAASFATFISPDQLPQAESPASQSADAPTNKAANSLSPEVAASPAILGLPDNHYVDDDGVCDGNTPCYATIQNAVDAADEGGDTVTVYPGVYAGFTITGTSKAGLTINGVNANIVYVDGDGGETAVTITNTQAITLSQLAIYNATNGITVGHAGENGWQNDNERIVLDHLLVHDVISHTIYTDRFSSLRLSNNTLVSDADGDDTTNIYIYGPPVGGSPTWNQISTDADFATNGEGGMVSNGRYLYIFPDQGGADIQVYDTQTSAWQSPLPMPNSTDCLHVSMAVDENDHLWALCSNNRLFEYGGSSWTRHADLITNVGPGAHIHATQDGYLHTVRGGSASGDNDIFMYTIASDSWAIDGDFMPDMGEGVAQTQIGDQIYMLAGGNSNNFLRHNPPANTFSNLDDTPSPIGVGAGLAGDGREWIYLLPGGNGDQFYGFHVPSWGMGGGPNPWETLDSLPVTTTVRAGGGLVRIDNTLYAIPGGDTAELWIYGPVALFHDEKIFLENNTFIHPDDNGDFQWYRFEEDMFSQWVAQPNDFDMAGDNNTWVGGSSRSPDPDTHYYPPLLNNHYLTNAQADYVDSANGVYRPGSASNLTTGHETSYVAEMTVDASGGGDTTSIQTAIDSSARRVIVKTGVYAETITAWPDVEIIGISADRVIVEPPVGTPATALVSAEGITDFTLQGVTLNGDNQGMNGFQAEDGAQSILFKRNIVRGTETAVRTDGSNTDLELINNTVVANTNGFQAVNCAPVDVRNTIFSDHSGTGLSYEGCAATQLHTYNLYWNNGTNQNPAVTGVGELNLDPLFVDASAYDYHTSDDSPVIDAGNPSDPPPPGTNERVDIGYIEQGRAAFYVDLDYCSTCENDGLTWGLDAFDNIPDGLNAAETEIANLSDLGHPSAPLYTVHVGDGWYTGTVTLPSYVRLAGSGPDVTHLKTTGHDSTELIIVDGVVHSEIRDLSTQIESTWMGGCAIDISGGSRAITITHNLFTLFGSIPNTGVCLSNRANASILFNTFAHTNIGVHLLYKGSTAVIANNIFFDTDNDHDHIVVSSSRIPSTVQIRYNVFHHDKLHSEMPLGPGNLTVDDIQLIGADDYHLQSSSPAIDAADPDAAVPDGGGPRADAGAFEYLGVATVPATLLLGHEDASTAIANSGVNGVEIGIVPVADPSQPITATEPSTWTLVTLNTPGSTVSDWQNTMTPATDGLYRFYSRATDAAANQEEDQWYDGAFIADGTPPAVTWLVPANDSLNMSPLELRAQVSDYALDSLSVADFYFMVDGMRQDATWSADAWDEAAQQPRIFRAWVDLTNGAHTVTAVATDHADNTTETAPINLTVNSQSPTDVISPTLTVISPLPNLHYRETITFTGTVGDVGSGVDVVQVSLDGGYTWQTAELNGSDWEYILENDDNTRAAFNYLVAVRALDRAGNETRQGTFIVSIDNRPPSGLFPVTFDIPPESHLDTLLDWAPLPLTVNIDWEIPWDFSGVNGDDAATLLAVDQTSDTIPTAVWPTINASEMPAPFTASGDWYIHLAARDLVGNQIVHHFGPWYVGAVNGSLPVVSRLQSINLDGFIDLEHDEWRTDWEYLDDGEDVNSRQELYFTLDGGNVYLGWRNSWWETDGTMWVYLDPIPGGSTQPVIPTDPTLPFTADYAIEVTGATIGRVWQNIGATWVETTAVPLELIQGDNGDTEFRLELNPSTITNLQLLAFAADDNGDIWRVFPTNNRLSGPWDDAYQWNPQTTVDFNDGQPVGVTVNMTLDSPQVPDAFHGPNETLDLVFTLDNLEQREISGLQLDVGTTMGFNFTGVDGGTCSVCNTTQYVIDVPMMPPTSTHTITVTGQLAANLSTVTAVTHTANLNSSPSQSASLSHLTDGNSPRVTAQLTPGIVTAGGAITTTQTVYGTADDHGGSGVALVEVRFNGGAWQLAEGTNAWQATLDAASGNILMEARATDVVGLTSPVTDTTYIVDITPPTLSMTLPLTLTGLYAEISGVSSDSPSGNEVARVEVQLDNDTNPWLTADLYSPNGNSQDWQFTWNMPYEDLQTHTIRARAVDWAGNISDPLAWQPVNVDTVLPDLQANQEEFYMPINPPLPPTVLQGTVADGSGVAGLDVWVYDPTGRAYTQTVTLVGNAWIFQPDFNNPPEGRYGLWAQATDNSGNQKVLGPYWLNVVGPPQPPTLDIVDITTPISEGETAILSGNITDPNIFDTFTMTVKWGDGITTTFLYPEGTTSFVESHVYADDDPSGTPVDAYTVNLTLEDSGGLSDDETINVTVQNVLPVVTVNADQTTVQTGMAVSFTGVFTDAGLADTHSILWEFGDSHTANELMPTHTFASAGVYTATLTITDDDGGAGHDQVVITVGNALPTVTASADLMTVSTGTAVSFTGIFTDTDQADTHTILWEFGDGATADTLTTSHVYTNSGNYTAILTITDNHGGIGRAEVVILVESNTIYLPIIIQSGSNQTISEPRIKTGRGYR